MESSSKSHIGILLICMLFLSSATPILGCGTCGKPAPSKPKKPKSPSKSPPKSPITVPPVTVPPIKVPPVTVPVPPVTVPVPPVTVPPVLPVPPVTVPPVTVPPITVPPVLPYPPGSSSPATPCPPPSPSKETCPIDTLKLGACVDLLGGLVHVVLGDPAANECCPILKGLVGVEAAACLCTTLKIKALNLSIYVPIALQLLVACGKTPPPGYTCSI